MNDSQTAHLAAFRAHHERIIAASEAPLDLPYRIEGENGFGEPMIHGQHTLIATAHHECVKPSSELHCLAEFACLAANNAAASSRSLIKLVDALEAVANHGAGNDTWQATRESMIANDALLTLLAEWPLEKLQP